MVDVTFVIVSQGRESLKSALASASSQEGCENCEIIVVDTSGSRAVSDSDVPGVVLLRTPQRSTAAYGRAFGIREARGVWIAFLDDDDICSPFRLREQLRVVDQDCDLVTSDFVEASYDEIVGTRDCTPSEREDFLARRQPLPSVRPIPGQSLSEYLFRRDTIRARKRIVTSSILVRRSTAMQTPWRAELSRFEDWDWLLRLTAAGARWRHVPSSLVAISLAAPASLSLKPVPAAAGLSPGDFEGLRENRREFGDLLVADIAVPVARGGEIKRAFDIWKTARVHGRPGWQSQTRLAIELALVPVHRIRSMAVTNK